MTIAGRSKLILELADVLDDMDDDELERFVAWMIANQYSDKLPWNN